jgi:PilZ domain
MGLRSTRRALRHSLIVDVEVVDLKSGIQIRVRTRDLNLYGCGVSPATTFPAGTKVMLKMAYGAEKITAFGKVIYVRQDIGMGIVFTTVEPEDQKLLEDWIAELSIPQ